MIAVGSDLDGMSTQNWRMPQPPTLVAINVDAADAAKNYAPDVVVEGDAALGADARRARRRRRASRGSTCRALRRSGAGRACAASFPSELALPRRLRRAVPARRGRRRATCASPATGSPASTACPRRGGSPTRWAGARSASPSRPRWAPRRRGPTARSSPSRGDGGFLFAVRRARDGRAGGLPLTAVIVDDGGYGMLRFDQRRGRRERLRRRPAHAGLRRAGAARSASRAQAVDGLGDAFARGAARHVADPEPTRARGAARRSSRRRRRRRAGTGRSAPSRA